MEGLLGLGLGFVEIGSVTPEPQVRSLSIALAGWLLCSA